MPVDVIGLQEGRQRYAFFTNAQGGLLDDLMIARHAEGLHLVVNAACAAADIAHLESHVPGVRVLSDRALLALQGPMAATVLERLVSGVAELRFMDVARLRWEGVDLWISRSGYTGEDGFEISLPVEGAEGFARALLRDEHVAPIGLGARDNAASRGRIAALRAGPRAGDHAGGGRPDLGDPESPPSGRGARGRFTRARTSSRRRSRAARHASVSACCRKAARRCARAPRFFAAEIGGKRVGVVTSGGFAPSLGAPVALAAHRGGALPDDAALWGEVRGRRLPCRLDGAPPFVAHRYHR